MFEVLVYLFENYFEADIRPEQHTLTRELYAAGFSDNDVMSAFAWFGTFDVLVRQSASTLPGASRGLRVHTPAELEKLGSESLGFLLLQEQVGALDPIQRELIIDRAMALPSAQVQPAAVRQIMHMALQTQSRPGRQALAAGALLQHSNTTLH